MEFTVQKHQPSPLLVDHIYTTPEHDHQIFIGTIRLNQETKQVHVTFQKSENGITYNESFANHPWFVKELFRLKKMFEKQTKIKQLFPAGEGVM